MDEHSATVKWFHRWPTCLAAPGGLNKMPGWSKRHEYATLAVIASCWIALFNVDHQQGDKPHRIGQQRRSQE